MANEPFAGADANRIVQARPRIRGKLIHAGCILATALILTYFAWAYESALRDRSYFDGWLLASAIGLQIWFHARRKVVSNSFISNKSWLSIHIFNGYVIIGVFLSHTKYSLPDSFYEWLMWLSLVLVSLSGIFGTYLKWGAQAKLRGQDELSPERAKRRHKELAVAAMNLARPEEETLELPLPTAPYQAWLEDFYKSTLRPFFGGPQNYLSHMVGSQRHMKKMLEEIDGLDRYLNQEGREKLHAIKQLVLEKDRLDFALVQMQLSKIWLLVHLPLTYGLFVLAFFHVIVVYSFASGAW
ncbi:MAG: hypothetical protein KTR19_00310 [Hyphomicrobiales bacterium]|nr:hypothetical protein [Hyphomicrobiales bacterium]